MGAPGRFAAPVASPSSPQSTATGVTDDDSTHQSDVLPLALVGIVRAMMRQEEDVYAYHRYRPDGCQTTAIREKWRQDICHWTYSVVDHFDLSRETVAISLSLFDRYCATLGNQCDGSIALLTSLTTLSVAVKINETKSIHLRTLADLSRKQFTAKDIERFELKLLKNLSWRVNPPTSVAFVHQLLKFVSHAHPTIRRDMFELSRYLCELSLCDAFFCDRKPSSVAYAAILNVFDFMAKSHHISSHVSKRFIDDVECLLRLDHRAVDVIEARTRMQQMFASSLELYARDGSLLSTSDVVMECCESLCSKGSTEKSVNSGINHTTQAPPQRVQ